MLKIKIKKQEQFNEKTNEFFFYPDRDIELQLEHSLLSVSKWESKWKKPFLSNKNALSNEELIDYIRCMSLNSNVDPDLYNYITMEDVNKIASYIGDSMTATTFGNSSNNKKSLEIITSEIIYYWMVSYQIPFECQKWHLNRLITLIRVCSEKNAPKKKMKTSDIYARNRALNKARKEQLHTRG